MIDWFLNLFHEMEQLVTETSQSPWFLLLVFSFALMDSVIPLAPSEFAVIAGGVASGAGTLIDDQNVLSVVLVILAGALGAYAGDSLAYLIGSRAEGLARRTLFRGEKGERRLAAAGAQIRRRGGMLLLTARFIPGGRTAMTLSCGLTGQPFLAWFTRWDLLAASLWATYAGLLGFFFGDAFENQSTALWVAFGTAVSISISVEAIRWLRARRQNRRQDQGLDTAA
ncbi:MAG: DedA family protein [Actinomycetota bacterium]